MLLLQQGENFRFLSEQSAVIQKQNEQLMKQIEDLKEQVAILTQQRFGRSSEKNLPIQGQLSFDLDHPNVFNEAEILTENGFAEEPLLEDTVPVRKPRPKGKRAVDLSGRPYLGWDAEFSTEKIGDMATEMVKEFFYAVSYSAAMNLHIKVLSGGNSHHVAEAMFKSFAKALDAATQYDSRITDVLSTKGSL